MHIHALIQQDGQDFVRDPQTGKVVFVEMKQFKKDDLPKELQALKGYWTECVRCDDGTIHQTSRRWQGLSNVCLFYTIPPAMRFVRTRTAT
jgi:hypothetical protein